MTSFLGKFIFQFWSYRYFFPSSFVIKALLLFLTNFFFKGASLFNSFKNTFFKFGITVSWNIFQLILQISFIKRQTSGTSSDNEWQRVTTSGTTKDNKWQRMTMSNYELYNEPQRMATSDKELERVTTSDKDWQRVTTSDNKWQ